MQAPIQPQEQPGREGRQGLSSRQDCFLCALDSQPCAVQVLEGRITSARQFRDRGELLPYITIALDGSHNLLVTIKLTRAYNSLAERLIELGQNLRQHHLTLRVYHLPDSGVTSDYRDGTLTRYTAGDLTLAILEPDIVLNITDLSSADYCSRQYLLNRLVSSPPSQAATRGNMVHYSFKELLKDFDRGVLSQEQHGAGEEAPLTSLHRHFEEALKRSEIDLALSQISAEAMRADVEPHLQSLANWFEKQHATLWDMPAPGSNTQSGQDGKHGQDARDGQDNTFEPLVRAEPFLLAPEIGLRGRLDLLWSQRSRQRLLELKTGGANGELPKSAHRWQVQGYLALLAVRRDPKMKNALATLLYSGTPGEATDFGLRFTDKQFQRVVETRNLLVFSHVTGRAAAPPGASRCSKCAMQDTCATVSSLLDWQPPLAETPVQLPTYSPQDRDFFARNHNLLRLEEREIERQQAMLWLTPMQQRIEQGSAIGDLLPLEAIPSGRGEWQQTFACKNTSELRSGDEVLLSDGNPITGEVVTGTITAISSESVTVWSPERIVHPRLIDRYDSSIVHVRTLHNLLRWLSADERMRQLVAGTLRPQFSSATFEPLPNLNDEQNLAVERAVQMQDYLLIHGPPGTGKTAVIAAIVQKLTARGERVLLAAFTNQAVDNMLSRLEREGYHDFVRLGHDRSVDARVSERLLKHLVDQQEARGEQAGARELLSSAPVVASTTATWSSEKYSPSVAGSEQNDALLQFDVAILDEAGQLTIPALLGALRFARRFILVGDEMQLPPLVLSKQAAEDGLKDSLFSYLKQRDSDYTKEHPWEISACVSLKVQYRMNRWISHFASRLFYQEQLRAHSSVAERLLTFPHSQAIAPALSPLSLLSPVILRALDPNLPMVFVDVQGLQNNQESEIEGPKMSNAEALAVRELVAGLLAHGVAEGDIGIIAPFKAQVANIRRHLFSDDARIGWQALSEQTALSVDTVDRFQGGERPVMILSFATRTTPELQSQVREHLTDRNRLNVALTRAQHKLLLVGHSAALESLPVFGRLLAYCRGLDAVITLAPTASRAR